MAKQFTSNQPLNGFWHNNKVAVPDFLECQAGAAVEEVYNPAIDKAVFLYAVAHYAVVLVSVYPEVPALLPAPVKTRPGNAVAAFCAGKAVDRAVRCSVIQPMPAFDLQVCLLNPGDECKIPIDVIAPDHITHSVFNVIPD